MAFARPISMRPLSTPVNRYPALFAAAFEAEGLPARQLRWFSLRTLVSRAAIIHWPKEFFVTGTEERRKWVRDRMPIMRLSRRLGVRWVWVVHNLQPHDAADEVDEPAAQAFMRELDGLIFLSATSAAQFDALYPELRHVPRLVTRHGDYRSGAIKPPSPFVPSVDRPRLRFAGLVRPYKNLEELIGAAEPLGSEMTLDVTGYALNAGYAGTLRQHVAAPHVRIDIRGAPLEEPEIEALVDGADALVLPYRRILNSGTVLFGLSRNRPVIAPALGSLTELQAEVGRDWLYLYDGELTTEVLRDALRWLRETRRGDACALTGYDWKTVGRDIVSFVRSL